MENHSETQSLQMSGNNSSSVPKKKQSFPFLWYCCLWTPIVIMMIMIFIVSPLIIIDIVDDNDFYREKNITIINQVWKNNTEVVICSVYDPCYVTCEEIGYQSDECTDNHTLQIIGLVIIGIFSLVCFCQICKLIIGYICYKSSKKEITYGKV